MRRLREDEQRAAAPQVLEADRLRHRELARRLVELRDERIVQHALLRAGGLPGLRGQHVDRGALVAHLLRDIHRLEHVGRHRPEPLQHLARHDVWEHRLRYAEQRSARQGGAGSQGGAGQAGEHGQACGAGQQLSAAE